MRLGLFLDAAFREENASVWSGEELYGFSRFAAAVGSHFESFTLVARASGQAELTRFKLPDGVRLEPLPHYPSLRKLASVIRAFPATALAMNRAFKRLDLIWVAVGSPVSLLAILIARLQRLPVVILVRQDTPSYFESRLPSRRWSGVLLPVRLMDICFRWAGRRNATTAVGSSLAEAYGWPRENVLRFDVNLVDENRIADVPASRDWGETVRLLTVGRIEPEKTPQVLIEALSILNQDAGREFRSAWIGEGRLRDESLRRARELGLSKQLEMPGFIPFGEQLIEQYRAADVFVHVAATEGVPGVLWEAMAAGLPIVATDVGGVAEATEFGKCALLIPPGEPRALAEAILHLLSHAEERRRIAAAALERAKRGSLDVQSARVASFLRESTKSA